MGSLASPVARIVSTTGSLACPDARCVSIVIYFTFLGTLGGFGHFCLILALRKSEASLLAPFSYFDLVFSACLGIIFFTEYPSQSLIIGAVIIVGAGIYTWYRERVQSHNQSV